MQPRVVDPIGERLGGQRAEDVLGRFLRQPEVVYPVPVVGGEAQFHRGHGGDGPGYAHELAVAAEGRDGSHRVVEVQLGECQARRQLLGRGGS